MKITGHLAGGYLVSQALLACQKGANGWERTVIFGSALFGSILPDLDYLVYLIQKQGFQYENDFQHHKWVSHTFPFYWLLSSIIFLFGIVREKPVFKNASTALAAGTTIHLMQDMVGSGDGIMVFYPFSRQMYGIGLLGKHGREWLEAYQRNPISHVENFIVLISTVLFLRNLLKKRLF